MVNLMLNLLLIILLKIIRQLIILQSKQRKEKKFLLTGKKANILGMMINQAQEDH